MNQISPTLLLSTLANISRVEYMYSRFNSLHLLLWIMKCEMSVQSLTAAACMKRVCCQQNKLYLKAFLFYCDGVFCAFQGLIVNRKR